MLTKTWKFVCRRNYVSQIKAIRMFNCEYEVTLGKSYYIFKGNSSERKRCVSSDHSRLSKGCCPKRSNLRMVTVNSVFFFTWPVSMKKINAEINWTLSQNPDWTILHTRLLTLISRIRTSWNTWGFSNNRYFLSFV